MPKLNLGRVVGPQGPQGVQGPEGPQGPQGLQGEKGDSATINGQQAVNIVSGNGIEITQQGETVTISTEVDAANRSLSNLDTPQQALANLGAGVRPNLLDNPRLAVNQRGLSQYTGAVQTVDRWMSINPSTWEKVPGGWKITQGTVNGFAICQKKEKIAAGTYTISVIVSAVTGTWGLLIQNQQEGNLMITEPGVYSATVTVNESEASPYLFILCSTQAGDTITLPSDDGEVAKVEEGEGQTLFYKDEEGSWKLLPQPDADYSAQLRKCQRYLVVIGGNDYFTVGSGVMRSATEASIVCPLPVPLRVRPVVQMSGVLNVRISDMEFDLATGVLVDTSGVGATLLKITCANSHTAGSAAEAFLATEGKLFISAEL